VAVPLLYHNASDKGRVRQVNEDAFGAFQAGERRLFVVADGMGGEKGGQVASMTAVAAVREVFEAHPDAAPPALLQACVAHANEACLTVQRQDPELSQMGTTLELLLVEGDFAWWAHVGDSRIYRVTGGRARQETRDHTRIQQMLQDGLISEEDAADHPQRNVLSRVVGRERECVPDVTEQPIALKEGDAFLMCSDGLTDLVTDEEIASTVGRTDPGRGCKELIRLALARGAPDNVTVQIVYKGKPLSAWQRWRTQPPTPGSGRRRTSRVRYLVAGLAVLVVTLLAGFGLGRLSGRVATPVPNDVSQDERDSRSPSPTLHPGDPLSGDSQASDHSGDLQAPLGPRATHARPSPCTIDRFAGTSSYIGSASAQQCLAPVVTHLNAVPEDSVSFECVAQPVEHAEDAPGTPKAGIGRHGAEVAAERCQAATRLLLGSGIEPRRVRQSPKVGLDRKIVVSVVPGDARSSR
jgi:protein phosphatase